MDFRNFLKRHNWRSKYKNLNVFIISDVYSKKIEKNAAILFNRLIRLPNNSFWRDYDSDGGRNLKTQKGFIQCVRENIQYKVINDVPFELLSFANPLDYAILDIRLDLVLNVRKRDLSPTALHTIALETINTRFPPEEWLHIYTDGSLLDFAQGAGIGVFSHLFSFYLHADPLTTHFDASRVAREKPWSTLCKKSHGIPSSPRAAAVAKFRLLIGHDCLCAHLFRFNLVTSPICVLCDTGQDMTAAHLDECSALNDLNCIKPVGCGELLFSLSYLPTAERLTVVVVKARNLVWTDEKESAGRRPRQGRIRATTPNEDHYLVLTARRHRNMNATLLQQHLRSATGTTVSTQTVRNWLHGVGLYARRPMSRFSVHPDNRRIFIWRDRGSRNDPAFVQESVRFGGGGELVYGGISIDGRTYLYIIRDGPLTARRYRDEILRPIVVPYAAAIGDDFILMDDNCRPPRANLDALGRRVAGRQPPPQTLQELERALLEEWDRIPQLVINSQIDSMPQRCSTLLDVHGNHTPY
ncbi:transposable element Tcb2 transposase [Trichonephila clavipes]|nr:transposable element Tcb2 transposase [Trichonephila clavipes]